MPHTVRVGDKFRLLDREWEVRSIASKDFISHIDVDHYQELAWPLNEADKLDWIKPVPRCSKEFAEALKARIGYPETVKIPVMAKAFQELFDWIDAHTED